METIIMHDFSDLRSTGRGGVLKSKQFRLYVSKPASGRLGTHTLSFSTDFAPLLALGFKFISIAENSLTGELFIVFNKEKGAEIKILPGVRKNGIGSQQNLVIRQIAKLLKLNPENGLSEVFNLSDNLSKIDSNFTFKILV